MSMMKRMLRNLSIKGAVSHNTTVGSDPVGNIARINNTLDNMPNELEMAQNRLAGVEKQMETAKIEVQVNMSCIFFVKKKKMVWIFYEYGDNMRG